MGKNNESQMKSSIQEGKVVYKKLVTEVGVEELWNAWVKPEELTQFFAPVVNVDLRIGGPYEMIFLTDNPEGQRGGEGNKVLSYLPKKMLSFQWNAPPEFPEVRKVKTWVILFFNEQEEDRSEMELYHYGWQKGGEWEMVFHYFENAWETVLFNLKQYLEDKHNRR